ncbi:probable inactive receptor kinase At4g23740 isoform X1 [Cucumis sativus]|uniref:probable inactive receptor kinase At4g23740 isoform X1 n=1 Tax=Cucumis sativus TaxID=3659 RepID=UPI0012F4B934|nr:probable inactive receptor kinase At4g23740 isoform X1 [Cucumis sativus]XP_031745297.1 probable inactive receptor kinase At4g23740 isoform X1 [Cucumis sativus]
MHRCMVSFLLLLWLMSAAVYVPLFTACSDGGLSASEAFLSFIKAIDPQDMLGIGTNETTQHLHLSKLKGVKYSPQGAVVEIRFEKSNLSGRIDADSICKLSSLRVLNLAKNNIQGNIPNSIVCCTRLIHLNLSNNNLSGELPFVLTKLKHLRRIDIYNNHFTTTSPQFKELMHRKSLRSWVARRDIINPSVKAVTPVPSSSQSSKSDSGGGAHWLGSKKLMLLIIIIVGSATFLILSLLVCKRTSKLALKKEIFDKALQKSPIAALSAMSSEVDKPDESLQGQQELMFFNEEDEQFKVEDLLEATADLQSLDICTSLFKVRLKSQYYAVKTLRKMQINFDEFRKTMMLIGNLRHPNILPLVGYYSAKDEKLLIYKYQRRGSLHEMLESCIEGKQKFPWRIRLSIACGIAKGVGFIYQRSNTHGSIPHGNLKLSNILLNENNEPKISEYGITKFLDAKRVHLLSSKGYTAPEKKLSEKADVYSFGIILLELLTGKMVAKDGINLPKWVRAKVREEWTCEVFDEEVARNAEKWAFSILLIALDCVSHYPEGRPTMVEALEKIEEVVKVVEDHEQRISPLSSDFGSPESYR